MEKVNVKVAGREYALVTAENPDFIKRAAELTDRKIREAGTSNRELAATGAAMSMAEELLHAQEENAFLRKQLTKKNENT